MAASEWRGIYEGHVGSLGAALVVANKSTATRRVCSSLVKLVRAILRMQNKMNGFLKCGLNFRVVWKQHLS